MRNHWVAGLWSLPGIPNAGKAKFRQLDPFPSSGEREAPTKICHMPAIQWVQWSRLLLSYGPNCVGVSPHFKKKTHTVSQELSPGTSGSEFCTPPSEPFRAHMSMEEIICTPRHDKEDGMGRACRTNGRKEMYT
jgi:hypothetical protein